jgi:hypothetical protein
MSLARLGYSNETPSFNSLVHLAGNVNPFELVSGDKSFPLHGPAEWLRHGGIEVGDEIRDPLLEMIC